MNKAPVLALKRYVYARNARRSAEREAEGFTSGRRITSLIHARREEEVSLMAIADWVEDQARATAGLRLYDRAANRHKPDPPVSR